MSSYIKKLKDPRWQKKRLEILNRDDFKCKICSDNQSTLHVHHIAYVDDDPWNIKDDLLVTLCERCHQCEEVSIKDEMYSLNRELKEKGFMSHDICALCFFINKLSTKEILDYLSNHPKNNG